MAILSLGISEKRLEEVRNLLSHIPGGAERAVARALNRALLGARLDSARLVKVRYSIKVSDFSEQVEVLKASPGNLVARLVVRGKSIPITEFTHRPDTPPNQKGIPVSARKKIATEIVRGRVKVWTHAFLAEVESGHIGLFERKGKKSIPIREYRSLSIPQMYGYSHIINQIVEWAQGRLDIEIDRQVGFMLNGGN